jgi:2-polyprenyl-3-methyl-5-hydroxy-6-metoxy-1,4-benzoquinol methylase
VVALAAADDPPSVLEVGCGQGWLTQEIAIGIPTARITGIDIREDAIGFARSLVPQVDFQVADGTSLPFEASSFDLVVCAEVLEHVTEPTSILEEIDRVGSGHAIITVPHEPWFWLANLVRLKHARTLGNCPGHINHWSKRGFAKLLTDRYVSVSVESSFPWLIAEVRTASD